jgi:hypothetical protein
MEFPNLKWPKIFVKIVDLNSVEDCKMKQANVVVMFLDLDSGGAQLKL